VLRITDNGPGIPAEIQQHIFDPFFSTKRGAGGTGLGLSLCHSIIADHQGSLSVESQMGRRTTFTIRLPPHRAASDKDGQA
jgi:signal transduction histidine kinase